MAKIFSANKRKNEEISQQQSSGSLFSNSASRNSLTKDRSLLVSLGYFVGRKIDSGTFATVRYAEKTTLNGSEALAVKIIDKAKASPLFTQKFLMRELDIWPKLRHRHIIQVDNILPIQDRIYVFMELAAKGSVIDYIQRHGAVSEDRGRSWSKQMCQALRYCHKKGIAHRDLKCDNLLLDRELQIKIGDFGFCCKSVDKSNGEPLYSSTYCGSSSYVAPEVIQGKPYDPIMADVWSAGVCVYVILNNAMPFDDTNITRMHEDQVKRNWGFSPEVINRLSSSSKRLITRMLDPAISERPTMDQVLNSSWMRMRG